MMEHAKAKAKQHTVYKNNNDVRVPGGYKGREREKTPPILVGIR